MQSLVKASVKVLKTIRTLTETYLQNNKFNFDNRKM